MKKIFAILMTIFLLASVLCVAVFAADEPAPDALLRVSAQKGDDTLKLGDYTSFESGWEAAIDYAEDHDAMEENGYSRIVVDLFANWNAEADGDLGNGGDGFEYGAIHITEDSRITLNLNGHTIDRRLTEVETDGEVIYIDNNADVIINDGTITGGYSDNGAGGIHIKAGANVTLNDVDIVGNKVENDDGAGIAVYDGAVLVMNGGSFENNRLVGDTLRCFGGGVYVNDSTATFNGVAFKNNQGFDDHHHGAAIYAVDSKVTLLECTVDGNGIEDKATGSVATFDTVYAENSMINIERSTFTGNGSAYADTQIDPNGTVNVFNTTSLILLDDSTLTIDGGCSFSGNAAYSIIHTTDDDKFYISNSTFTNNKSEVLASGDHADISFFRSCVFNNNKSPDTARPYSFDVLENVVTFYDCELGDSTFDKSDADFIKFATVSVTEAEATIGVKAILADGTVASTTYYKDLAGGWNAAMELAVTEAYDRITVDLYADWKAGVGSSLGSGVGFRSGAILIPENTRVTLNLNGHTIDRNRDIQVYNGEVIRIAESADVIINKGTVKGGYNINGAGGIHILDNASVSLTDVHVVENGSHGADGVGIAVYDGAVLVMNGGSISNNIMKYLTMSSPYGSLYVSNATATLNNVTISGNHSTAVSAEGVAIYVDGGTVTLNSCTVSDNAKAGGENTYAKSVIAAYDAKIIISFTDFKGNGSAGKTDDIDYSHLFYLEDSSLSMLGGTITNNAADKIFYFEDSKADITSATVTGNHSVALDVENDSAKVTMTECLLGSNSPVKYDVDVIVDEEGTLIMKDCSLGDTIFDDKDMVSGIGSMIGDGSLTNILVILSLAVSAAAIALTVFYNKKRATKA